MSTKKGKEVTENVSSVSTVQSTEMAENSAGNTLLEPTPSTDKPIASYHITSPEETKHLANDLARFIRENKLFHNIQGKEYVNVEGWQYAGCRLGILPVVDELSQIKQEGEYTTSADREIKYQAKVKLLDLRTNQIVGTGFAICSNKESSKKYYQEFAIASMAQTRAIGKAYRNILAWIIRAAGYEPTPAEEMDYIQTNTNGASQASASATRPLNEASVEQRGFKPHVSAQVEANSTASTSISSESTQEADNTNSLPITINQKTQILLLLNNSVITKEEKERMVVKINTLDTERAEQAIVKLKKVIKERAHGTDSTAGSGMAA